MRNIILITGLVFALFLGAFIFNGCCTPVEPAAPEIATPPNCDVLNITEVALPDFNYPMQLNNCLYKNDSIRTNFDYYVIRDTNNLIYKCSRDYLQQFDFDKNDFLYGIIAAKSDFVYAAMNYKVFINHKNKKVIVKTVVATSGGCGGSELKDRVWRNALVIPKVPNDYTYELERNK